MAAKTSSANAEGVYEPFAIDVVPWEEHLPNPRFGMRFQELGKFGGRTRVGVCMEVLPPGKQANPEHYHLLEEEHLLILEGRLTLLLGGRRYEMSAGDYACFPAGQKAGHALVNGGSVPCRYLIIGDRNPHDVAVFPDTGRVSVRLTGEGYRRSATMDYWEGVDTDSP